MGSVSKTIGIIVTSHRAVRVGPAVGSLVHELLQPAAQAANIDLQTVQVKSFNLPVYEGPIPSKLMAQRGIQYEEEGPRAWAETMASLDGYIFVINEYCGMSGATKNALDYLYAGFVGKPAMVVSYGGMGGGFANEQVRGTLARMGVPVVEPPVELAFKGGLGPDMFLSVNEGKVGDETRALWTGEKKGDLVMAFGALEGEVKREKEAAVDVAAY